MATVALTWLCRMVLLPAHMMPVPLAPPEIVLDSMTESCPTDEMPVVTGPAMELPANWLFHEPPTRKTVAGFTWQGPLLASSNPWIAQSVSAKQSRDASCVHCPGSVAETALAEVSMIPVALPRIAFPEIVLALEPPETRTPPTIVLPETMLLDAVWVAPTLGSARALNWYSAPLLKTVGRSR